MGKQSFLLKRLFIVLHFHLIECLFVKSGFKPKKIFEWEKIGLYSLFFSKVFEMSANRQQYRRLEETFFKKFPLLFRMLFRKSLCRREC